MSNITTTTGAVFLPELWSVETLRAAEAALTMAQHNGALCTLKTK